MTNLTHAEKRGQDGRACLLGERGRKVVQERDEQARVLADAQHGKHALEREDDVRVKIWGLGGLERLVVAEEREDVGRKATEAEVKVARFACRILLREGIAEHVDLCHVKRERGWLGQDAKEANPLL